MDRTSESNKALVLEAFDTLFNKRDYAAAENFWSALHSTQRSYRARPGGLVRSRQELTANAAV
jgi:hypothetical protein